MASRITQAANDQQSMMLRGNISPRLHRATDQGRLPAATPLSQMALVFRRSDAQQNALDLLLDQQQDPASLNYHKWLTPEQFGQRFGLSAADLSKITNWLQARGFRDIQVARGLDYVTFDGTAGQVESAFRTQINRYVLDGKSHYANATEPSIPAAFASVVAGIRSLTDFRPKPRVRVQPKFTSSSSGNHFVAPADFATI
ncbi:MAG TPA: protease pro-enzyme activation domain-containing protein, partial [Terriglobales bacterium]